jgi:hypothetical protein
MNIPEKQNTSETKIYNVYTYWHDENLPVFNKYCIDTWKKHNPDFNIIVLNDTTIHEYIKEFPINIDKLIKQHKSDYIRTYLLYHYGGIWLDSSIILKTSLDNIFNFDNINKLQMFHSKTYKSVYKKRYLKKVKDFYCENSMLCSLEPKNKLCEDILKVFSSYVENLMLINNNTDNIYKTSIYFKNAAIYKRVNMLNTKNFFTHYFTHMNIISYLMMTGQYSDCYCYVLDKNDEYKHINFLFKNSYGYSYNANDTHLKIVKDIRYEVIKDIEEHNIKNNDSYKNMLEWIDIDYFDNKNKHI